MRDWKFAVLRNEHDTDYLLWEESLRKLGYQWELIDLTRSGWLEMVMESKADCFLLRPPGYTISFKKLYDERTYVISQLLGRKIYPSLNEYLIYENKRMLSYWLKSKSIPHPETWTFYHRDEALGFAAQTELPLVAKTITGAGGSGVNIFRERKELIKYIETAFSDKGIKRQWLPNIRKGDLFKRLMKRMKQPAGTVSYLKYKHQIATRDREKWFVLFQQFIPVDFEWRCVRIDESFFGHKKVKTIGEKMSGTSAVSWDWPSGKLLDFMKMVTDKGNLYSQSLDIFETPSKEFLVNELQCFWGSKNPHQMIIRGNPGRFVHQEGQWIFEKGEFNTNNSYDLRVKHAVSLLEAGLL